MVIKIRKHEFEVGHGDLILDNGACYILITKTYYSDYTRVNPTIPKSTFKRLLKDGDIRLSKKKYGSKLGGTMMDLYEFV